MRAFGVCAGLLVMLLASGAGAAAEIGRPDLSKARVLAIAPFADDTYVPPALLSWGPRRLKDLLAGTGYQIVAPEDVAAAMKRLGISPRDLVSLTRTVDVGTAVGADAVLTGRITHAQWEAGRFGIPFGGIGRVVNDVRVLEVATRLKYLQDEISCQMPGPLQAALDCVVRNIAGRLTPKP
jgi:hypothetical protein